MTAIWMGRDAGREAVGDSRPVLTGNRQVAAHMEEWLGLCPFAQERR